MKIMKRGYSHHGLELIVMDDRSCWVTQLGYSRFAVKSKSGISRRCSNRQFVDVYDLKSIDPSIHDLGDNDVLIKARIPRGDKDYRHLTTLIPSKIFEDWVKKDIPKLGEYIDKFEFDNFLYVATIFDGLIFTFDDVNIVQIMDEYQKSIELVS